MLPIDCDDMSFNKYILPRDLWMYYGTINRTPNRNLRRTTITIITIITNAMYISVFNTMLIYTVKFKSISSAVSKYRF